MFQSKQYNPGDFCIFSYGVLDAGIYRSVSRLWRKMSSYTSADGVVYPIKVVAPIQPAKFGLKLKVVLK